MSPAAFIFTIRIPLRRSGRIRSRFIKCVFHQSSEKHNYTATFELLLVPIACHLARGGLPSVVGKPIDALVSKQLYRPIIDNNTIKGMVCYIDKYGNLMTNITKQLFKEVGKNRSFRIYLTRSEYSIQHIHQNFWHFWQK